MGYRRIHGELLVLGVKVAASTVWEILKDASIDPAPDRSAQTWAAFLRSQADAILAADFIEAVTLTSARMYVFAVIELLRFDDRELGLPAYTEQQVRSLYAGPTTCADDLPAGIDMDGRLVLVKRLVRERLLVVVGP